MFKKIMMCAVMMSASLPICAGKITITSLGDAYRVSIARERMRRGADGNGITDTITTQSQLKPNMSMEVDARYPDHVFVTIERIEHNKHHEDDEHNRNWILCRVFQLSGRTIELDKDTCKVNGQQVDAYGNKIQD